MPSGAALVLGAQGKQGGLVVGVARTVTNRLHFNVNFSSCLYQERIYCMIL